jgi:hypothetical protein
LGKIISSHCSAGANFGSIISSGNNPLFLFDSILGDFGQNWAIFHKTPGHTARAPTFLGEDKRPVLNEIGPPGMKLAPRGELFL